ncbi:MAG: PorV/PorQ family protein [Acidobacteria bacterium]|nr:PorV/PorQ family protein [Acidobacteriota bacterium]
MVQSRKSCIGRVGLASLCVLGGLFAAMPAWSIDAGEAAYTFLKIGTDARAEGMGGAQTGLADGLGGSFYNPAALALALPHQVMATYNNWVTDIQSGFLAGTLSVGDRSRLGVAVQYMDYGNFAGRDVEGNSTGGFSASDVAFSLGFAGSLGQQAHWGAAGRLISESIDNQSSMALALDVGVIYAFADGRTRAGLAVRNVGEQTNTLVGGHKDELPLAASLGLSHHLHDAPLLVAADLLKPIDDDFGGAFGIEFSGLHPLQLRAGYNTLAGRINTGSNRDKLAGLTLGLGFIHDRITVDYAFGAYSKLGDSHRFTLRTSF